MYFLLPNKTEQTYTRMVQILANLLPYTIPEETLLDFEVAVHNAFRAVYRNTLISSWTEYSKEAIRCRFEAQVSDVGLKRRYPM